MLMFPHVTYALATATSSPCKTNICHRIALYRIPTHFLLAANQTKRSIADDLAV